MTTLARLSIQIAADVAGVVKGISQIERSVDSGLRSVVRSVDDASRQIAVGGAVMSAAITAPLLLIGKQAAGAGIGFASLTQQAEISLTTMLGSAERAQAMLADLADFAARTPFEMAGLLQTTQRLLAFGFAAEEVKPILTAVGDAAAGLSLGAEGMNRLVLAMGQMRAKGKVSGEEMRQLAEAGIPALQILAESMNKTTGEVMELSERGLIPADLAIRALTAGMEERFGGMMDKQSKSFAGLMSTLRDSTQMTLGAIVKPGFDEMTNSVLPNLIAKVDQLRSVTQAEGIWSGLAAVTGLSPSLLQAAAAFVAVLAAAGPVLGVLGAIGMAVAFVVSPLGALIAVAALLAAAWAGNFFGMRAVIEQFVGGAVGKLGELGTFLHGNLGAVLQVTAVLFAAWAMSVIASSAVAAGKTVANTYKIVAANGALAAATVASTVAQKAALVKSAAETGVLMAMIASDHIRAGAAAAKSAAIAAAAWIAKAASLRWVSAQTVGKVAVMVAAYAAAKVAAVKMALASAAAWVSTMLPAAVGAIGAILAAIAPFLLVIAAIGAAIAVVAVAWQNNWFDIQGFTARAIQWVGDRLRDFLEFVRQIPGVGGLLDGAIAAFKGFGEAAGGATKTAGDAVSGLVDQFKQGFPELREIIQGYLGLPAGLMDVPDLPAELERELREKAGIRTPSLDEWTKGIAAMEGKGEKAKDTLDQIKGTLGDTDGLIRHLVAMDPAAMEAARAVETLRMRAVGLEDQLEATRATQRQWRTQLDGLREAQERLSLAHQREQEVLRGLQERVSALSGELATARRRLDDLARPRLEGMGEFEDKLFYVRRQLDLLEARELGLDVARYAPLTEWAREFTATLPQSRDELERLLKVLETQQKLEYDEQLREIAKAAAVAGGQVREEMTFAQVIEEIGKTGQQITGLESALKAAEAAVAAQEQVVRGYELAQRALNEQIREAERALKAATLAEQAINQQLQVTQEQLKKAEERQAAVNKALAVAYGWYVDNRLKVIELGGEMANQATIIDEMTRKLVTDTTNFVKLEADAAVAAINAAVEAYQRAKGVLGMGGAPLPTPTGIRGIDNAYRAGGIIAEPVIGMGLRTGESYSFGERGVEYVVPADQMAAVGAAALAAPGERPIIVQFHGPVYGFDDFESQVVKATESARRRGRG